MTPSEETTLAIYENEGALEVADPTPMYVLPFVADIFKDFPQEGTLLDIGCGDGRFVPLLPDLGIPPERYLGMDLAEAQVRFAQKRFPNHSFEAGSFYEVGECYPGRFSGLWCTSVLMHIPRSRLSEALSSLRASMQRDAVGLISTYCGNEDVLLDNGMLVTLYGVEELVAAFHEAGFYFEPYPARDMVLAGIVAL